MTSPLPRIITRKELRQLVPFCPQHILRLEKAGTFPKRIKIGARRVGWWLHEILAWIAARNTDHAQGAESESQLSFELHANGKAALSPAG